MIAEEPKIDPGVVVPRAVRNDDTSYNRATHVERINPGNNPADIPGAKMEVKPMPEDRGMQRNYRMLSTGFHNGAIAQAGSIVQLYDDEVGKHHELLVDEEPAVEAAAEDAPKDTTKKPKLTPARVKKTA